MGDGEILYTSRAMKKGDAPVKISVDISDVHELRLETIQSGGDGNRRRSAAGIWAEPLAER